MAGTDSPFVPFGASLHAELWPYVDGGLSPFQALQTATINAAKAIGVVNQCFFKVFNQSCRSNSFNPYITQFFIFQESLIIFSLYFNIIFSPNYCN